MVGGQRQNRDDICGDLVGGSFPDINFLQVGVSRERSSIFAYDPLVHPWLDIGCALKLVHSNVEGNGESVKQRSGADGKMESGRLSVILRFHAECNRKADTKTAWQ